MTGHRLLPGPASSAAAPLDDNDLLTEVLIRIAPLPSSIPRVSLVCRQWRRLVADPHFLHLFRSHHRKAPLLGFFSRSIIRSGIRFTPALDSPDCIPADCFHLGLDGPGHQEWQILSCRHGRVLLVNRGQLQVLVWAPITGDQRRPTLPPEFAGEKKLFVRNGVVICAADEVGHVHGSCHACPFQVILLSCSREGFFASVYSSVTGAWGSLISFVSYQLPDIPICCSSTVVGNSICSLLTAPSLAILEFDFSRQILAVTEVPSDALDLTMLYQGRCQFLIAPADAGGLTFLVLSGLTARLWERRINSDVGAGWVLGNTVELGNLLPLGLVVNLRPPRILGFAEDDNAMLLWTEEGSFMVHVESMRYKKLARRLPRCRLHPFTSFYSAGA